ncbi:hypothetical protein CC86DRAFT_452075 [Ophiobolus disseminans]|uniref:Uncharacterized protein n=1 Tax=Ophiobolus disseminans TaxID=1469910 RepID=A0A6A7AHC9_9PLEO|nr:hypothetical protein CC86DRAFT_452075 [Ophiobolus disseminans]
MRDMRLLSALSQPITIVSDPYHFLSITPHTLVMPINAPGYVPVHEIMADSLFPSGPAVMLYNEIMEQPWHKEGMNVLNEARRPRVAKMLKLYNEPVRFGDLVKKGEEGIDYLRNVVWYSQKE